MHAVLEYISYTLNTSAHPDGQPASRTRRLVLLLIATTRDFWPISLNFRYVEDP